MTRTILRLLRSSTALLLLVVAACAGPLPTDPGGAVRAPELGSPHLRIVVLAGDDLTALNGNVLVDGRSLPLDAQGSVTVAWPGRPLAIDVTAPGFRPSSTVLEEYPSAGRIEFRMDPVVLAGRVTTPQGIALPGVHVVLNGVEATSDDEGRFHLERATPGELELTRPAWRPGRVLWDGNGDEIATTMDPLRIRALRAGADAVGDPSRWQEILSLADLTGIDGLVIDLKDEEGTVPYDTEVTRAHEIGAVAVRYDLGQVLADLEAHDLYGIGRIVVFQDPLLASAEPDHAVMDEATGALWETKAGKRWLDPSDPASFEYAISLAEEACRRGFDEIQFDYVAFPFGGSVKTATFDGAYTEEVRVASIDAFLERAYSVLDPMGCAVGANVLAITLESGTDEGIGQRPGAMSRIIDVLSPMVYSTNYRPGWKGFADPDANAVAIVGQALDAGVRKLEGFGYYRPWLQTWKIGTEGVRGVTAAAEARDMGWMLWSTTSSYDAATLPTR